MLTIQIIGAEDSKQKQLVQKIKDILPELPDDIQLETISDWEDIITFSIVRTPALLIRSQVLSQGFVPSLAELRSIISSFIVTT